FRSVPRDDQPRADGLQPDSDRRARRALHPAALPAAAARAAIPLLERAPRQPGAARADPAEHLRHSDLRDDPANWAGAVAADYLRQALGQKVGQTYFCLKRGQTTSVRLITE